ncbi:MAG: ribosome hibernation-promoting factor, HPF/YfiA family [Eubacteriales bacterium]|jgi:putative sigma-54 modulation protein
MKIKFNARKYNLTDDVKARFQKKLAKLDRFFFKDAEATVTLYEEKVGERVEITVYGKGVILRAEETDRDAACALDKAIDVLIRQIRKNRTRLERQKQIQPASTPEEALYEEETDFKISKIKRFVLTSMSVEEAILQMNLLSHEFYIFKNAETGVINLVYKRKNNDYGLIEPVE